MGKRMADAAWLVLEELEASEPDAKKPKIFRQYRSEVPSAVRSHYKSMRVNQTVASNRAARAKYGDLKTKMTVWEAFDSLTNFIDVSDPDVDLPNAHHLFQSAEGARMDGQPEWMQFTALIHDLGKCVYLRGCDEDGTSVAQQWAVVGDTFVLGDGPFPDCLVHDEFNDLSENVDLKYQAGCGLDNVLVAYGHDEYFYHVLKHSPGVALPDEALYIVRYHSLYPWHTGGAYKHLENDHDRKMKNRVLEFNQYDLYTKRNTKYTDEEIADMKKYYDTLVNKFAPDGLIF